MSIRDRMLKMENKSNLMEPTQEHVPPGARVVVKPTGPVFSIPMSRAQIKEIRDVMDFFWSSDHWHLADHIYDVKEREMEGWDGDAVTAFSDNIKRYKEVLAGLEKVLE